MAFEKFKKIKFTARTASAGTKFKPYYQGISRILKTGGQSKGQGGFFDYKRAAKNPDKYHVEVDEATGERATYIERNEYREQMLTAITGSFGLPDSITASISASFFSQIGDAVSNLPPGEFVAILSSPTNERPTASFGLKKTSGILNPGRMTFFNNSTGNGYTGFTFSAPSSHSFSSQAKSNNHLASNPARTHLTRSAFKTTFLYGQDENIPEFSFKVIQFGRTTGSFPGQPISTAENNAFNSNIFKNTATTTNFQNRGGIAIYALTSSFSTSADFGVLASGSGNITQSMIAYAGNIDAVSEPARRRNYGVFYNGVNGRDGLYNQFVFKGFLSGESFADINSGDVEETLSFIGSMVVPYFSSSQKVQSGVFRYVPEASGAAAAFNEGSSTLVTLFYPSASLGNGPSGSYTGSFIGFSSSLTAGGVRMRSGSHLFLDRFLTTPASAGFYYIPGTNSPKVVLGAFKGFNSTFNSVPFVLPNDSSVSSPSASVLLGNNREEVPRWASKSLH